MSSEIDRKGRLAQWLVGYCAAAWVGLQVVDLLASSFTVVEALVRPLTILAGFGLLGTAVVAWFHADGICRRIPLAEGVLMLSLAGAALATVRIAGPLTPDAAAHEVVEGMSSVAVLPFENLSGDSTHHYFVRGFHDNLLAGLSSLSALSVASRRAVGRYRDLDLDLVAIADELGVATVLEGSVQREGDHVRVSARLVDPRTQRQVWAATYDREIHDVFAVQSEITREVAWALQARLTSREEERVSAPLTRDLTAMDFYTRGIEAYERMSTADNEEAVRLFREAIALDPDFAAAWARLGDAYMQRVQFFGYPMLFADSATAMAEQALSIDPGLALAHKSLGVARWMDGSVRDAMASFHRAIELEPNSVMMRSNVSGRIRDSARRHHRGTGSRPIGTRGTSAFGSRAGMTQALERVMAGGEGWGPPWRLSVAHAAMGDSGEALHWLERAFESGFLFPRLLPIDPAFDGLRGHPRFMAVLAAMRGEVARQRERTPGR